MNLALAAGAAAIGFAFVARAVAKRDTLPADDQVRRRATPPPEHPLRRAADAIAPIGKWYSYVPTAVVMGGWLRRSGPKRGRARADHDAASISIVGAALSSWMLTRLFDRVLPQPPTPPGHEDRTKPSFPSGHAFGPTAVGLTAAYALSRAALVPPGRAFLLALAVPVITAGGRFVEERHWLSDIFGGIMGGTAVAAAAGAGYELASVRG
jgi:membrane-associated phospholipid phosphatase